MVCDPQHCPIKQYNNIIQLVIMTLCRFAVVQVQVVYWADQSTQMIAEADSGAAQLTSKKTVMLIIE